MSCQQFPEWELLGDTPAVLRKSVEPFDCTRLVKHSWCKERQESEAGEESFDSSAVGGLRMRIRQGCARRGPLPLFFLSVASKGVSSAVSLLFATLAGRSISVAAKGLTRTKCWREGNWVGREDFGGVRRTAWRAGMVRRARSFPPGPGSTVAKGTAGRRKDCVDYKRDYSILIQLVKDYFKWFRCWGIEWCQIRLALGDTQESPTLAKKRNRKGALAAFKRLRVQSRLLFEIYVYRTAVTANCFRISLGRCEIEKSSACWASK